MRRTHLPLHAEIFTWFTSLVLFFASTAYAQSKKPLTLDLAPFDFGRYSCAKQSVEFLDDKRLLLSLFPDRWCHLKHGVQPPSSQITIIDLDGNNARKVPAQDAIAVVAGPTGYITIATVSEVKMLSSDTLAAHMSQPVLSSGLDRPQLLLSPSRSLVSIEDESPAMLDAFYHKARYRLLSPDSPAPIAEHVGRSISGLSDQGFAVCSGKSECKSLRLGQSLELTADLPDRNQGLYFFNETEAAWLDYNKHLHFISEASTPPAPMDMEDSYPPFTNYADLVGVSAAKPRRILLYVEGCLLGDYDDCYGVVFHRIAVIDPQSRRVLFRRSVPPNTTQSISPDGQRVAVAMRTHLILHDVP